LSVTGNVTGGNVSTAGLVSATGTVTGSSFVGSGANLTGVVGWTTQANTAPASPRAGDFWYNSFTGIKYQFTATGTSNVWVDQSSPTVFESITTGQIVNANANGVGNIGSAAVSFNTVFAKATSAQYADLAENYQADAAYAPGTVVVFGGDCEITQSCHSHDTRVAGVVSTDPAFLMNSAEQGLPVALTGRVPCQVQGPVGKGDLLVTSDLPGTAQKLQTWIPGCVIGKSLEIVEDNAVKTIEISVGRF
jgi:mono/diheme cytochrome c family protein